MLATKAEFDTIIAGAKPVVIDFTATWCPPCQMIGPKFVAMATEFPNVEMVKVDVDANEQTSSSCGIECMPTFQVYKDGKMVEKMEGADEAGLRKMIAKYN